MGYRTALRNEIQRHFKLADMIEDEHIKQEHIEIANALKTALDILEGKN